jgi:hypothetical protein
MKMIIRSTAEPMSVSFYEGCYNSMGSDMYTAYSLTREGWNAQKRSVATTYMMFSHNKINQRILTHSTKL